MQRTVHCCLCKITRGFGAIISAPYSTKFVTIPGDAAPSKIERKCQRNYQYVDGLEYTEIIQDSQQSFCVTDTVYEDGVSIFEWLCYCYADQCNVQANDANFPKQSDLNADCKSEVCTANGCVDVVPGGVCKGQYCFTGEQKFFA